MNTKQQIGKIGEDLATKYLSSSGYRILERNYRGKQGEIDIIATEKNKIIFVEVKARTNLKYGRPAEAVTKTKQIHIEQTAKYYVCKNKLENKQIRFDVVEVYLIAEKYKNSIEDEMEEFIFMGLRMVSGISLLKFKRRFGVDIYSIYNKVIEKNIKDGLLVVEENKMFLTAKGMELSNSVMSDFILDKLYKITRKRIVDDECIAVETVYIPVDYCGHVNKEMLEGSLYKVLEGFGYVITNSNSSIVAVNVNDKIRDLLECKKDAPILKMTSKTFTNTDKLLFLEEAFYKSDKFTLQVNISRKEGEIL